MSLRFNPLKIDELSSVKHGPHRLHISFDCEAIELAYAITMEEATELVTALVQRHGTEVLDDIPAEAFRKEVANG